MGTAKQLRVITSKRNATPDITYLDLQYGSVGMIGTLHIPNTELSDIIQSLRFGFDDLVVREARAVDVKREEEKL
jgi:hypothetical protein